MEKPTFERRIIRDLSYKKETYKKGYKIPIISDVMFHTMINNKSRIKYPAYFISLVLERSYEEVLDNIELSKNKLDKDRYKEKGKTADFVCTLGEEIINIEMNNNSSIEELERNIEYASKLYGSKNMVGKPYEYSKVVQININNFKFEGNDNIIETYTFRNEQGLVMTNKISIIQIYLPNIRKKMYNEQKLNELEKLLLVFNENKELSKDIGRGNSVMEEYVNDAIDASDDDMVLGLYDEEEHLEKVRLTRLRAAEREGREQGIEQGIITVAKNMLKNNIDINIIIDSTGLTKEELNKLL